MLDHLTVKLYLSYQSLSLLGFTDNIAVYISLVVVVILKITELKCLSLVVLA